MSPIFLIPWIIVLCIWIFCFAETIGCLFRKDYSEHLEFWNLMMCIFALVLNLITLFARYFG